MKLRTFLLGLSALFIASAAAYFSVTGLSKLFAGASTAVILMASSLEFGKLISASFLYIYWDNINRALRAYLLVGVCVLIVITSAGIYGFLTSAYQSTADQLGIIEKRTSVLQLKKARFEEQLAGYTNEKASLSQSISDLSKALSNNVIQYKDKDGNLITTTSSANRKSYERQLDETKRQRDIVTRRIESLTDSVSSLDVRIIEEENGNDLAAEVGPLKYMAEITGRPMATIVNWFALLIIFVFDPLAVTLVIAFNTAMKLDAGEITPPTTERKTYKVYGETPKETPYKITKIDMEDTDGTGDEDFSVLETMSPPPTLVVPTATPTKVEKPLDPVLANLKQDTSRRAIDINGDGTHDGWDTNGDGLIDKWTYTGSILGKQGQVPYYARPDFDWNDKSKWINDQNAVNYWITHRKFN